MILLGAWKQMCEYVDAGPGTPTLWKQVILVAEYLKILCLTKITLETN